MTTDHYGDAIAAGAAALAKPYREPETIRAFTDEYPTLAAARVLDAALPHMRAAIIAEGITPGPCPEVSEFGHAGPYADGVNPEPRTLRALCDLRAGHAGQHEAYDDDWGTYRWTRTDTTPQVQAYTELWPELANRCAVEHGSRPGVVCWREPGHTDAHDSGAFMWNDCGQDIKRDTQCRDMPQRASGDLLVCERTSGHPGWHISGTHVWDGIGEIVLT